LGTMSTSTKKEAELKEARRASLDALPMDEQANRALEKRLTKSN
jgi:hypothetical protein